MRLFLNNPSAVVLVDGQGSIQAVSNNVDPNLSVIVTDSPTYFDQMIKGLPFDSRHPAGVPQVLAHKKS